MAQPDQQLTLDRVLFHPEAAMRAMRDSRYRHGANAIAELIDNSIEADATRVEVLIEEEQQTPRQRSVWRVSRVAVADNGVGMDAPTLVLALSFGGRKESGRVRRISKYGVGLPTASASQCQRVDVWTWQSSIESPLHCYLDIAAVQEGRITQIPEPDDAPIPGEWRSRISDDGLDPRHGTLVVWSSIDRIASRSTTIFDRIEREIGRIYRHFLSSGELSIRMATYRGRESRGRASIHESVVRPNDPLFLMHDTTTATPWDTKPMFAEYAIHEFTANVEGREETIEVRYSIVKPEALGDQAQNPGSMPHGKDAMRNAGVSIVREDRELLLEKAFAGSGARREQPQNRWWGCEVRFGSGCDDLLGVDHNKQMTATLSDIAEMLATSDLPDDDILADRDPDDEIVYQIAVDIRGTTRNMLREISEMMDARRPQPPSGEKFTPEEDAEHRASQATAEEVEANGDLTQTDRVHSEASVEERQAEIEQYLAEEHVPNAANRAAEIVRRDFRYQFVPKELDDANRMFSVRSHGGVLFVHLNQEHDLYEFLRTLEEHSGEWSRRAAVAIRTLVLAWARMEDKTENPEQRQRVRDTALRWGRQAREVLNQINAELGALD